MWNIHKDGSPSESNCLGGNNAGWRTDPKRSGKAGCIGDIGTHAWHLSEYITGLKVKELCADLKAFVPGRPIDDDGAAFLRYENDVTGVLTATQIGTGEANNIRIRIYGEKGGLEWRQMEPNTLTLKWRDRPTEILNIGNNGYLTPEALWNTRTPAGHPEGFYRGLCQYLPQFLAHRQSDQKRRDTQRRLPGFPDRTRWCKRHAIH